MTEVVVRRQLRVVNRQGLHARPAASLVRLANTFTAKIELVRASQRVDAKSILQVMMLAAVQGTDLQLEVRGVDAVAAADSIEKIFQEFEDMEASEGADGS